MLVRERRKIEGYEGWGQEELDLEAQTFIILYLEKDVTFLINEEATTYGVWEKLDTNSNELELFEI